MFFSLVLLIFGILSTAQACDSFNCRPPKCRCISTDIPGELPVKETPQFVMLTFDDAVTGIAYDQYYSKIYRNRTNPNNCPITTTYFVCHEYTDYARVNRLYQAGQEIGLHSISHKNSIDYWRTLSVDGFIKEFGGQKKMMAHFAQIPEAEMTGVRMPFLQLSGNNSYKMIKELGLVYDSSWPTQEYASPGIWPYTLDYPSTQDCVIGPCPNEEIPGVWVVPMLSWKDKYGTDCSMVDACPSMSDKVNELFDIMLKNFERSYSTNRAPFGFYVHAAWFMRENNNFVAYQKFVDYLLKKKDVYLVGPQDVLKWMEKPMTVTEMQNHPDWTKCREPVKSTCKGKSCRLINSNGEERYMNICNEECPANYPWLDNPLGA